MFLCVYKCKLLHQHQLLLQQDSHYILRDPEDDAKLAKVLVENVLIKTVEWPSDDSTLEFLIEEVLDEAEHLDFLGINKEHESDEDEPLPYFSGAEMFGTFEQMPIVMPLGDLDVDDLPVLADVEAVEEQLVPDTEVKPKDDKQASKDEKTKAVHKVERKLTKNEKQEKNAIYAQYEPPENPIRSRTNPSEAAHMAMVKQLQEWQDEHGKTTVERPSIDAKYFYYDMRVALIQTGDLKREQSWDVCRTYLKHWVDKVKASLEDGDAQCEQDNQADEAEKTPGEEFQDIE